MEIFIAYRKNDLIDKLAETLESWDIPGAVPVALDTPPVKFELIRRVTADNLAKGDYILCDLGCVPNSEQIVEEALGLFARNEMLGLVEFTPLGEVRACRRGIVQRWPRNRSGDYQPEHKLAYELEGYTTFKCPTLKYRIAGVH